MDLRWPAGLLIAAIGLLPALAQDPPARQLDLSGVWRTGVDPAQAGSVTISQRRTEAEADRYALRVELPGRAPLELEAAFDGQRLVASTAPLDPTAGLGERLEGLAANAPLSATTLEWTLEGITGGPGRPPLLLFRGATETQEPHAFARAAFQLGIVGYGRVAVGSPAPFHLVAVPVLDDPIKNVPGQATWSAEPADAVELRAVDTQLLVVGKRAGKVTLTCTFLAAPLGDQLVVSRKLEVRATPEPLPDPSRAKTPGERLALEGQRAMRQKTLAHHEAIVRTGVGVYFGSDSAYAKLTSEEREEWARRAALPGATPAPPRRTSCIDWALECVVAAYQRVGRGPKGEQIRARVVAEKGKGTVLARELIADGWTGIYWNPDVRKPADDDDEHTYTAGKARAKPGSYYGLPVSGLVLDYRPTPGSPTVRDATGLARLAKVPFWFGVARGGQHTFVGSGAVVSEQHYEAMPNMPRALEETPLERFEWLSGLIVVPPGTW